MERRAGEPYAVVFLGKADEPAKSLLPVRVALERPREDFRALGEFLRLEGRQLGDEVGQEVVGVVGLRE